MNRARNTCTWVANAMLFVAWWVRLALINRAIVAVDSDIARHQHYEFRLSTIYAELFTKKSDGIDQQREASQALEALRSRLTARRV